TAQRPSRGRAAARRWRMKLRRAVQHRGQASDRLALALGARTDKSQPGHVGQARGPAVALFGRYERTDCMSKSIPRRLLIALTALVGALVISPAGASALTYHGYEIVPNGTREQPQRFSGKVGQITLQGQRRAEQANACQEGTYQGEFTTAKTGTMAM